MDLYINDKILSNIFIVFPCNIMKIPLPKLPRSIYVSWIWNMCWYMTKYTSLYLYKYPQSCVVICIGKLIDNICEEIVLHIFSMYGIFYSWKMICKHKWVIGKDIWLILGRIYGKCMQFM